jgi:deoxyribodipyrimidine photolyase-related protein
VTFDEIDLWIEDFIQNRLENFGIYQDAIVEEDSYLFHSIISCALNIGLITPQQLVQKIINTNASLNSKEGYIRQIIGWREFVKGVYHLIGKTQLESNFWGFKNTLTHKFYNGETGVLPVDNVIKNF